MNVMRVTKIFRLQETWRLLIRLYQSCARWLHYSTGKWFHLLVILRHGEEGETEYLAIKAWRLAVRTGTTPRAPRWDLNPLPSSPRCIDDQRAAPPPHSYYLFGKQQCVYNIDLCRSVCVPRCSNLWSFLTAVCRRQYFNPFPSTSETV